MAADDAAVTVTLRAELKGYEAALKTAVRSTERAAQAAEKAISGIGKTARPGNVIAVDFQKSAAQIQNDARVMQFQLNDVFSGLASGQGIRALQVQLGQIAQIMSGGGLVAGARTLGSALLGMVSPINLAVVAFGLAATAAADYFFGSTEGAKEAEKAQKELNAELKRQQDVLKEVVADWKDVPPVIAAAVAAREQFEKLGKQREAITIERKDLLAPITDALKSAQPDIMSFFQLFDNPRFPQFSQAVHQAGDALKVMISQLENGGAQAGEVRQFLGDLIGVLKQLPGPYAAQLAAQFEKLQSDLIGVTPAVKSLDEAMKTLGQDADRVLSAMLTGFQDMLGPLGPLIGAVRELAGALPSDLGFEFLKGIAKMPEVFRQAVTASGDAAREFLKTKAASKDIADSMVNLTDDMAKATAKLFTMLPDTARITSAVRSRAKQAQLYADFKAGRGGRAAKHSLHEVGAAVDVGAGVDMETLRQAVKLVPELEQLKGKLYQQDKVHVQLAGTNVRLDEEQARAIEQQADAAARAQENMQTYLRTLDEQASLQVRINEINTSAALNADQKKIAIEVETELQKAMNLAAQNNITLTQAQIDAIRQKAIANAQAGLAATAISDAEKQAAQDALKAQQAAKKAAEDQAQAIQALANTLASMATGALVGFVQDLRNGTDAAEALYNAISRIADQLLQMALNMMFKQLFGSLLGGLGGGLGGGGLFASGGYTGDRPAGRPAGIVHGQEFVINAQATRRHRDLLEAINRGAPGYASGGFVLPNMGAMLRNQMNTRQQPSPQQMTSRTTVVNTLDAGSFLSEALSRPDGVNVILNAVRAQPGAFRQAMQG